MKCMKITVYTISDCKFSAQEKDFLKSKNIAFEEKNLETNKDFLTEMLSISNNFAGTPVTKIEKDDGSSVVLKGFTQAEFEKELGLQSAAPAEAAPAVAPLDKPEEKAPEQASEAPKADEPVLPPLDKPAEAPVTPSLDAMPAAPTVDAPADKPLDMPAPLDVPPAAPAMPSPLEMPKAPEPAIPDLGMPAAPEPSPVMPEPVTPSIDTKPAAPEVPDIPDLSAQVAAMSPSAPAPMPSAPAMPEAPEPAPAMPTPVLDVAPTGAPTEPAAPAPAAPAGNDDALNAILNSLQEKVNTPAGGTAPTPPGAPAK